MEKSVFLEIIGKRIREVRLSKNLTQLDLVSRIDGEVDPTNISRIESGRTNPTIFTLHKLADAMEISLVQLLDEEYSLES
ncbi:MULTISPECIES: helix-turn-helix domain-containing protein [unclassified Kaistella]|uniref:helix-turn-helix domain-containing protein n=1 Tax=unclassified Kaistella TaxID=2762626 RepID=UPI0027327CF4|nr:MULTISPECIES: helix-turn-helix transcriptional regulator [unclassified Kaistella]MDP2453827.1 helix-turn-helix transcriptional regulator [Kaistella sp. SH11-4b]MDP2456884.1 helix-turn-helix transcriptional regulator [Kaistella sp. SH40-3]MDP2459641.1 helix-turn-helix transcriptional regulator [Kaistella sp. SH19-2b]